MAITVVSVFFKRFVSCREQMSAALHHIALNDAIVDGAAFSTAGQDSLVLHQSQVLRRVLHGSVNGGSYVAYGHLSLAQGPQDQHPRDIAKDPAHLGLSLCDLSDSGFHGLVPVIR